MFIRESQTFRISEGKVRRGIKNEKGSTHTGVDNSTLNFPAGASQGPARKGPGKSVTAAPQASSGTQVFTKLFGGAPAKDASLGFPEA